jgi:hypothetical protein
MSIYERFSAGSDDQTVAVLANLVMAEMAGVKTSEMYFSVGTCLVLRWRQFLCLAYSRFDCKSESQSQS